MWHEFTAVFHIIDWATLVLAAAILLLALFAVVDKVLDLAWPESKPQSPAACGLLSERQRLDSILTFGRGPGERRPTSGTTRAHEAGASASTPEPIDPRRI